MEGNITEAKIRNQRFPKDGRERMLVRRGMTPNRRLKKELGWEDDGEEVSGNTKNITYH